MVTPPKNNLLPPPWQVNLDFVNGPLFLDDLCTGAIDLLLVSMSTSAAVSPLSRALFMALCCVPLGPALLELTASFRCWSATHAASPGGDTA